MSWNRWIPPFIAPGVCETYPRPRGALAYFACQTGQSWWSIGSIWIASVVRKKDELRRVCCAYRPIVNGRINPS
jgi:hypothetical protein